jgi:hypothetical protein
VARCLSVCPSVPFRSVREERAGHLILSYNLLSLYRILSISIVSYLIILSYRAIDFRDISG